MTSQAAKAKVAKKPKWSRVQPLWQVVALNLLTVYGYSLFWFWKNWEDLHKWAKTLTEEEINQIGDTEEKRKILLYLRKMNVFIHSVAVIVDWIRLFFIALMFWQIGKLSKRNTYPARHGLLFALTLMPMVEAAIRMVWTTTDIKVMLLLMVIGTIPQVVAQIYLNDFWKLVEPSDLPLRKKFTANEMLLIAMGAGSIGLMVSGLVQPMALPPNVLNNFAPEIFGAPPK
jgi:hypothetical protein